MSDINIVWNPNKEGVITSLMTSLANGTGWTIGKEPRLNADLNYFGLYIQIGQSPQVARQLKKTAAWFSHYETQRQDKMDWWNIATSKVNIRTTTAVQYFDMLYRTGETHLVYPPPIDPQFITPRRKPKIGVAGFVHPSGRKGEHLVRQLEQEMVREWDIVASGQGWGIEHEQLRGWKVLPDFYRSLDVFLVTGITEGIPMPPLEALACGTAIVIPAHVGILNNLSEQQGVTFYEKDNYDEMLDALHYALREVRPFTQYAVNQFTQEAWCNSHKEAFGLGDIAIETKTFEQDNQKILSTRLVTQKEIDIIAGANPALPDIESTIQSVINSYTPIVNRLENPPIKNAGAVCVAYGIPSQSCAAKLIPTWNRFMPDYPIAMLSDSRLEYFEKDVGYQFIEHPDTDIGGRSVKTKLYDLAPSEWEYILYLDADTEIIADVSQLFQWLKDGWDFIICTNPDEHRSLADGRRPDNQDELDETIELIGIGDIMQPNGGVFAFARNERTEKLMAAWHAEWKRYGGRDQMAFLRALHNNPVRWLLLGNEWNTIIRSGVLLSREDSAGILHYPMTARRWDGIIYGKLDSHEAWKRVEKWERENL